MQDNYTTKGKHLTIDSRRLIERWKKEGKSNREIVSLLGKAPQTIHTEIKRGTVLQCIGKGALKSFTLPTTLNNLMKTIASARSRNQA